MESDEHESAVRATQARVHGACGERPSTRRRLWRPAAFVAAIGMLAGVAVAETTQPTARDARGNCVPVGTWLEPGGRRPDAATLTASLVGSSVVLLGEEHDSAEHHRWQLQMLAALHARKPDLVIGFEMFPRRVQPALDRWVAGELTEAQFLRDAEWRKVWTYDPQLYLPLFHFARMNGIPMVALNIEPTLTRAVSEKGFDAVAEAQRDGVSRPAPGPSAYRDALRGAYRAHERKGSGDPAADERAFDRFVDSQLTWDRAMAQALEAALRKNPGALAVGIVGHGHVANGWGVPHQLADLGVKGVKWLLPWDRDDDCGRLVPGYAHAVFGIAATKEEAQRPRLGVSMDAAVDGVLIAGVVAGSVAEMAGLRSGDLIKEIGGRPARSLDDVRVAVRGAGAGTWLPMRVRRDGATLDLVAKFPPGAP